MSFELKSYQKQALSELRNFLHECRSHSIEEVFTEFAKREGGKDPVYHDIFGEKVPCVCIRIPTGGGKTVIGASSIKVIDEEWRQSGAPVVLWLTPSDAITTQTIKALQNVDHPFRQMIDKAFNLVKVVGIGEVNTLQPSDFDAGCIVIVSTIQTFNIGDTDKRRVYDNNEAYQPYFANVPEELYQNLEKIREEDLKRTDKDGNVLATPLTEDNLGQIKASLANLLALHRPIVIVDEAHNNRTDKFFKTLNRIHPSAVLELTATPIPNINNTIFQVSAWELKAADMIKLPIVLRGYDTEWQACLTESLSLRTGLDQKAQEAEANGDEYVRPILLIQAQPKGMEPGPEVVKKQLIALGVPEHHIAIATGEQKDLEGIDLFSRDCPITCVITIKALKEGWDCPFAYVLCSLQNIHSAKDVEQLLGRVMRMPYAKKRSVVELNRAYASVVSNDTLTTAQCLKDRLVESMGFDEMSAAQMIEEKPPKPQEKVFDDSELDELDDLFKNRVSTVVYTGKTKEELEGVIEAAGLKEVASVEDVIVKVKQTTTEAIGGAEIKEAPGRMVLRISQKVTSEQMAQLREAVTKKESKQNAKKNEESLDSLQNKVIGLRAKQNQALVPNFVLPLLCYRDVATEEVRPVSGTSSRTWIPTTTGLKIEFSPREKVFRVEMDIADSNGGQKQVSVRTTEFQDYKEPSRLFNAQVTEFDLIRSISQELKRPDVISNAMANFVRNVIQMLKTDQHISLTDMLRNRIALAKCIRQALDNAHEIAMLETYQQQLELACCDTENVQTFRFDPNIYEARRTYDPSTGRVFEKHYYPVIDDLRRDTASGNVAEEYQCAEAIELTADVDVWVRNIPNKENAFSLPLPGGKHFYPDFVAHLKDGRVLVVEYKGDSLVTADDAKMKKIVGDVWEKNSGGKGLFLMAVKKDAQGRCVFEQIADKIIRSA